jgi:hypothetical protein
VKVSLLYPSFMTTYAAYGYAPATDGIFTFQPGCTGTSAGMICALPIPGLTQIVVEQMPAMDRIPTLQTSGITGSIQASYTYRHVFGYRYFGLAHP